MPTILRQPEPKGLRRLWLHFRTRNWPLEDREAVLAGFPREFRLPYPYPRNEHEDGMNWVAVNGVVSARADW